MVEQPAPQNGDGRARQAARAAARARAAALESTGALLELAHRHVARGAREGHLRRDEMDGIFVSFANAKPKNEISAGVQNNLGTGF